MKIVVLKGSPRKSGNLGWEDCGQIVVPGVWAAGDIQQTDWGQQAYELGRNI